MIILCTVTHVTDYDLSLLVLAGYVLKVQLHCCCINHHYIDDILTTQLYDFYPLQDLPTFTSKNNPPVLPRANMRIFIWNKLASPAEFKCESNALIFNLIGQEMSELQVSH
jgi:hypothetical protein